MNQIRYRVLAALLVVGLLLSVISGLPRAVMAEVDSWSGHKEFQIPFSVSVTTNAAPALICTAVAGTTIQVKSMVVTNSADGLVILYNGSAGNGAGCIGCWSGTAKSPIPLSENIMRQGLRTTSGTGLYLGGTTGTVTGTVCVREDF